MCEMLLVWMRQCGGCRISRLSGFPQFNRVELESGELELDAAVNGLNLAQQTGLVASQTMEARTERSGIGSRSIGYQVFCSFTSFYYRNSCSQPTTRLTHTHYLHPFRACNSHTTPNDPTTPARPGICCFGRRLRKTRCL